MALKGAVARRYAEAVFEMGRDNGSIERWRTDIQVLSELFSNRRLQFLLSEPKVPFTTKEGIIRDLTSTKVQPDAMGLALVLVERNLVSYMPRIATEFETLYNEYKNQIQAVVTTALPLDAAEEGEIIAFLQRITGKNITLATKVDPDILGGMVARIGDTLIDGSVRRKLEVLREQIVSGAVAP